MNSTLPILWAAIGAPFLAMLGKWLVEIVKMRMAASALKRDPLYDVGSEFWGVWTKGRGKQLCGECHVVKITARRIVVHSTCGRRARSWPISDFMDFEVPVVLEDEVPARVEDEDAVGGRCDGCGAPIGSTIVRVTGRPPQSLCGQCTNRAVGEGREILSITSR